MSKKKYKSEKIAQELLEDTSDQVVSKQFVANKEKYVKKFEGDIAVVMKNDLNEDKDKRIIEKRRIREWAHDEYRRACSNYKPMSNIAKYPVDVECSAFTRYFNISMYKFTALYDTMNTIVIVMKLHDGILNKETNYGLLFCEADQTVGKRKISYEVLFPNEISMHGIYFTFYSCGPSFQSLDGEYRPRLTLYSSVEFLRKSHDDILSELMEYVERIKIRRQWTMYPNYFYPRMEVQEHNVHIEYNVRQTKVTLILLTITWFLEVYNAMFNLTEPHINEVFRLIFYHYMDDDIIFMREIIEKYGADRIEEFMRLCSHSFDNIEAVNNIFQIQRFVRNGFKMIPLNIKEVQDPVKLRYRPWREVLINQRAADLVINVIAPGFSVPGDWMYIKNSRKGLFDNPSQYKRMQYSEMAKEIVHILYEAERNTYFLKKMTDVITGDEKKLKDWIDHKFKHLNKKIHEPISYCTEDIIMSEVTLAYASEFMGRTIRNSLELAVTNEVYNNYIGDPLNEAGFHYFNKYMFDLCYHLYCMNTKLGIIHGDLHLHNATIGNIYYSNCPDLLKNRMFYGSTAKRGDVDVIPCVLYALDDSHQYLFPTTGYTTCIIDFSRAILHYDKYELYQDASLPRTHGVVSDFDTFKADEIANLMTKYLGTFPGKARHREELSVIFKNHFEAIFRLLTPIDLFVVTSKLIGLFGQLDFAIYEKAVELVTKLNRAAETYITTEINHLINDPEEYSKKVLARDYPMGDIIRKTFSDYNNGQAIKNPNNQIIDAYCYGNEFKYSLDRYSKFPPFLQSVCYRDDAGKLVEMTAMTKIKTELREEYEAFKAKNISMMDYIAQRHVQKIY
jgi:hypothetical protein